jgi:hypothetical protein
MRLLFAPHHFRRYRLNELDEAIRGALDLRTLGHSAIFLCGQGRVLTVSTTADGVSRAPAAGMVLRTLPPRGG